MFLQCGIVSVLLACCACADEVQEGAKAVDVESSPISPALEPKSDKKFFDKDYPWDKRPKVDVFHFKHPYPVVQDSGDFDSDYVKDENSDNGSWKAQTEYDRLRHQLAKEKADVAKALSKTKQAETELQDAMHREQVAVEKFVPKPDRRHGSSIGSRGTSQETTHHEETASSRYPEGVSSPGDVRIATQETQKAMDALEDCKKQLAQAREQLKKLMKKLEEAKRAQDVHDDTVDKEIERDESLKKRRDELDKHAKGEYQQYMQARNAFLQQQALLAQMEKDIKVASEKVKAIRDAEDKNGGVYNSPGSSPKSATQSMTSPLMAFTLSLLTIVACFSY